MTKELFTIDRWGRKVINAGMINPAVNPLYSPNMFRFFNKKKEARTCCNVIEHHGKIWLVDLWKEENEFAGVIIGRVAAIGAKAWKEKGWPTSQRRYPFNDITEAFWQQYLREGMYGFPTIWWNKRRPVILSHAEYHQV